MDVDLAYEPREWQEALHEACESHRFVVCIVHRRGGKTYAGIHEQCRQAFDRAESFGSARVAYIAPSLVQAKRVASQPMRALYQQLPGAQEFKGDARWELPGHIEVLKLGVDHFDSNRGIGLDHALLDETALFSYGSWDQVIRPTLSDRQGGALFIGTLDEGGILLDDLDAYARQGVDPDWCALSFDVYETGAIPKSEIESLQRTMSEEAFAREYLNQRRGARGAYYARLLHEIQKAGRITRLPPLNAQVHVCSDLGLRDSTSLWFYQQNGAEIRWLASYENEGEPASFYAKYIRDWIDKRSLTSGTVYLPHDGIKRELTSGLSVQDVFRQNGLRVMTIQTNRIGVPRGIEAVRQVLPNSWFDVGGTSDGRKALWHYKRHFNTQTGVLRDTPLHDWASHYADAMRTGALAIKQLGLVGDRIHRAPRPRSFMST